MPTPKAQELRPGDEAIYREDRAVLRIRIIENMCDVMKESYRYEILEVVTGHPFCEDPKIGEVNTCSKMKGYVGGYDWHLSTPEEDPIVREEDFTSDVSPGRSPSTTLFGC